MYTLTIGHRPTLPAFEVRVPYNVVTVELEEGVFMVSNLVECPNDTIHIGLPVEVVVEPLNDTVTLPKFRPRR